MGKKFQVFIDGCAGTTGLRIFDRLSVRDDITLLTLSDAERKDPIARRDAICHSDITFLCLPDDAARESVALAGDSDVRIIDASTAHRTNPAWDYGFPELSKELRTCICHSKRVAVPGCYATGFASLVYPLIHSKMIAPDYPIQCFAISGYSGGGKKMIAQMESSDRPATWSSPQLYGLSNAHKHLPEMQQISGLLHKPMFTPIVDDFYNGMMVCVPLQASLVGHTFSRLAVQEMYASWYQEARFVHVMPFMKTEELSTLKLSCNDLRDTNDLQIFVCGDDEQILLCARLDNLGKGASGAAVQCMNLMLGVPEEMGLLGDYETSKENII